MGASFRFLLGIASFIPICYFVLFGTFGDGAESFFDGVPILDESHFAVILSLGVSLLIGFIAHASLSSKLQRFQRAPWIGLLIVLNFIAVPLYWMRFFGDYAKEESD